LSRAFNNIANIFDELGYQLDSIELLDSALFYYDKVIFIRENISDFPGASRAIMNKGVAYLTKYTLTDNIYYLEKAYDLHLKSLNNYMKINNLYGIVEASVNVGSDNVMLKKYDEALIYLFHALSIINKDTLDLELKKNCLNMIVQSYDSLHNCDSAYYYFRQFRVVEDSLYMLESDYKVEQVHIKYQTKERDEKEKLYQEQLTRQKWIKFLLLLAIVILCTWIIYVYLMAKKYKSEEKDPFFKIMIITICISFILFFVKMSLAYYGIENNRLDDIYDYILFIIPLVLPIIYFYKRSKM
jgi:tetratricopeptide (TPR) repeat protein